jgi:oligoribonuclease
VSASVSARPADRLVWVDCEMTGLDLSRDVLVEVALVVTDGDLEPVAEGMDLLIQPPAAALAGMEPVVRQMHTGSGLLAELAGATLSVAQAEAALLSYLRPLVPEPRRAPLCGNTVYMDRAFLARDMPEFESWLHYRLIDVSSIKELARRWFPKAYYSAPTKTGGHRALGDITDSIAELRYYRSAVFVPPPGPDSEAARQIAASLRPSPADPPVHS